MNRLEYELLKAQHRMDNELGLSSRKNNNGCMGCIQIIIGILVIIALVKFIF